MCFRKFSVESNQYALPRGKKSSYAVPLFNITYLFYSLTDPKLPSGIYEMVIEKMLIDVKTMANLPVGNDKKDAPAHSAFQQDMKELFLNALRAWGPISSLRERIKLQRSYRKKITGLLGGATPSPSLERSEVDLYARLHQSAAGYLMIDNASSTAGGPPSFGLTRKNMDSANVINQPTGVTFDALFDINIVSTQLELSLSGTSIESRNEKIYNIDVAVLEAMAELEFMMGRYEDSIRLLLSVGLRCSVKDLSDLERDALNSVYADEPSHQHRNDNIHCSHHALAMIESHHVHRCLLDEDFLESTNRLDIEALDSGEGKDVNNDTKSPILALIYLVGLDLSAEFLVEHTVLPSASPATSNLKPQELSANLPINMIAHQLRTKPILLHWYLHQIFINKPEVYVKFPNTAVPPRSITELHRIHLDLHIRFAEETDDKERSLADIPSYDKEDVESPLMSFLKVSIIWRI